GSPAFLTSVSLARPLSVADAKESSAMSLDNKNGLVGAAWVGPGRTTIDRRWRSGLVLATALAVGGCGAGAAQAPHSTLAPQAADAVRALALYVTPSADPNVL